MPEATTDVAVMRFVVREGFSYDLADALIDALRKAVDFLTTNPPVASKAPAAFSH